MSTICKYLYLFSKYYIIISKIFRGKLNNFKCFRYVWPWAKIDAIQHDSYNCQKYLNSEPFPIQRNIGPNNFIGSANKSNSQWNNKYPCPIPCRPTKHQDWIYC